MTLLSLAPACVEGDGGPLRVPAPSQDMFVAAVYPVLLRDCGSPDCHGTHERFFQVFGPGRTRLDPAAKPLDPPSLDELGLSYARARSMLASPDLLLLRKPLAIAQGGAGHEGDDAWNQAVYRTRTDPGYLALDAWMRSAGGTP
ncbi:MAG: hypothetical protein ABW252_07900 [Polyangiales bacterium]